MSWRRGRKGKRMNISKQTFERWKRYKYLLACVGAWIILQIPIPIEYKDMNICSVNIPILGLMFIIGFWSWIFIKIDIKLEKAAK